jgi:hypothetical protein
MYKCINTSLRSILKEPDKQTLLIKENIIKASVITRTAYIVLRKLALDKYANNNLGTFRFTTDTILMALGACRSKFNIRDQTKLSEYTMLKSYLPKHFTPIYLENMTQSLVYYSETMLTSIENNIKNNYVNYIKRYINAYFDYKNLTDKATARKELAKVKNDIIFAKSFDTKTWTSNSKYHDFIANELPMLNPNFNLSKFGLQKDPQQYLECMIDMNLLLEEKGYKQFQFFPTQMNNVPRSFAFDTTSILYLFGDENGLKKPRNLASRHKLIWPKHFDFSSIKCNKNYEFDNCIITDGIKASVRFIKSGTKTVVGKNLSPETKLKNKEIRYNNKLLAAKQTELETPLYLTDMDWTSFNEENDRFVYIDPGKRSLLTMLNDQNEFQSFTNAQYMRETGRLKYQKLINALKPKEIEAKLSEFSAKTCYPKAFEAYVDEKAKYQNQLDTVYLRDIFRKISWYKKINKMRSLNLLVETIKRFAGVPKPIIIIGDWGIPKQMRNFISTPNLELKRWLAKNFELYEIDEYKTSKIIHHTLKEKNGHLKIGGKKQHSILTYQMENKRLGCINRDRNSCHNIRTIARDYLFSSDHKRPECFCRI